MIKCFFAEIMRHKFIRRTLAIGFAASLVLVIYFIGHILLINARDGADIEIKVTGIKILGVKKINQDCLTQK